MSTHSYTAKQFSIHPLEGGISTASVEAHIGLYQAYVKNFNAIEAKIAEYRADTEANALALSELVRRRSFEWGGMRLHELYFAQWEGGAIILPESSPLSAALAAQFGSVDGAMVQLRAIASMRGPGWALLYWDDEAKMFHIGFSEEQHIGHFASLPVLLALDVWEHAFLADFGAAGKTGYLDAFFKNLNWAVVEKRFAAAQG